jgi:predicted acyltransferase
MARVLRRGLLLFGVGLLLNGLPWVLGGLRIPGVLQRIGVTYVLASLIVLRLPPRRQYALGAAVLIGYWAAIALVPIPGVGRTAMTPAHNLPGWLDAALLGRSHLYGHGTYDPEGLLSTLPAVVTVLFGYWSGEWLRRRPRTTSAVVRMVLAGAALAAAGAVWTTVFPANKRLWTSSFVLLTAGLAAVALALCFWAIDIVRWRRFGRPFEVMGLNAIFAYVASEVGGNLLAYSVHPGGASLREQLYASMLPWTTPAHAALAVALGVLAWWWMVVYAMYRRHWFLKI